MSTITIGGTELRFGSDQADTTRLPSSMAVSVTPEPERPSLWTRVAEDPRVAVAGAFAATGVASSIASYRATAYAAAHGGDDAAQGAVRSNASRWYAAAAIGVLLLGAVVLANSGGGTSETNFTVKFDTQPDFTAAQSVVDRDQRKIAVYEAITEHYNANKGPIEAELAAMQDEAIVTSWTPVPASNGISVTVAGGKDDEFLERMQAVANVGETTRDDLQALGGEDDALAGEDD